MMVSSRTAGSRRGPVAGEAVRAPGRAQRGERLAATAGLLAGAKGPSLRGGAAGCRPQAPPSSAVEARGSGGAPFGQGSALPRPPRPQARRPGRRRPRALPCVVPLPRCTRRPPPAPAGPPQLMGCRGGRLATTGLPAEAAAAAGRAGRAAPAWGGGNPGEGAAPLCNAVPLLQRSPRASDPAGKRGRPAAAPREWPPPSRSAPGGASPPARFFCEWDAHGAGHDVTAEPGFGAQWRAGLRRAAEAVIGWRARAGAHAGCRGGRYKGEPAGSVRYRGLAAPAAPSCAPHSPAPPVSAATAPCVSPVSLPGVRSFARGRPASIHAYAPAHAWARKRAKDGGRNLHLGLSLPFRCGVSGRACRTALRAKPSPVAGWVLRWCWARSRVPRGEAGRLGKVPCRAGEPCRELGGGKNEADVVAGDVVV